MNGLHVNLNANSAQRGPRYVKLSVTEAEFATILYRAEGRPVSKPDIMRGLYGALAQYRDDRVIKGLARRVREKFTHLGATIESDIEADSYRLVVVPERVG